MTQYRRLIYFLMLCTIVAAVAVPRLQMSYDLGAFLPAPTNSAQEILTSRLGQGPGAQLIFLQLSQSSPDQAATVAERIRALNGVARVLPEEQSFSAALIPQALWAKRLLLRNLPDSVEAWTEVFEQRIDQLAFAGDDDGLALIAADPALISIDTLSEFTASISRPNLDQGDRQYLIIETKAAAYDLASQSDVVGDIRGELTPISNTLLLGGPVYGVDLRSSVQFEATAFSLLASVALIVLMIFRFRSLYYVISIALPLLAGGLVGLLALTVVFSTIHGITLAFGFTLLGVAIDYPLHLFTHAQHHEAAAGSRTATTVWPTLRLGIFSTLIAYAAFIATGTMGLQQLGIFATVGIATAAVASAWLSAERSASSNVERPVRSTNAARQRLRYAPGVTVIVISAGLLTNLEVFNDDLGSLTPVDPQLLSTDAAIRRQLGVTDIRHIVSVRAPTLQNCLEETEDAVEQLSRLMNQGTLSGIQAITQILPSEATQKSRRALLKQPDSRADFNQALALSAFQADAFSAFLESWQLEIRNQNNLTLDDLQAEPALTGIVDSLLYQDSTGWVSLLFLQGISDLDAVAEALSSTPNAQIVDLKETSTAMVSEYRSKLLIVLVVALLAISMLLITALSMKKLVWLLFTVVGAVTLAAAVSAILQGGLSLFDLMALTLVAGLGLDYALFYSSDRDPGEDSAIDSAVLICALSSLLVFGVLSFSSIPVLSGIGTTVSIGVVVAYLLARFGRYANSGN